MTDRYALILAGGGGTRLWPASRRKQPKQLLTLGGPETLLAATFRRAATLVGAPERVLVVTAADQAQLVAAALPALPRQNVVVEPAPRNTAAAVGLGAVAVARRSGPDALMAILPSDAYIADEAGFAHLAGLALDHAAQAIVTLGIQPTAPETGYGYLRTGAPIAGGVREVIAFVEKPDLATARRYVADGYLWNAGMFFISAGRLFDEADRLLPALGAALARLRSNDSPDVLAEVYPPLPRVSIDNGIMEHAAGILVVPADIGWSDVGSWDALSAMRPADATGNVRIGDTVAASARDNVIVSEDGAPLVAVSGVEGLVVVATRDAVLVTRRDRAQSVRDVVEALRDKGRDDLL